MAAVWQWTAKLGRYSLVLAKFSYWAVNSLEPWIFPSFRRTRLGELWFIQIQVCICHVSCLCVNCAVPIASQVYTCDTCTHTCMHAYRHTYKYMQMCTHLTDARLVQSKKRTCLGTKWKSRRMRKALMKKVPLEKHGHWYCWWFRNPKANHRLDV